MTDEQKPRSCEHRVLDGGIHEFVMLEFSRAGVDAFLDMVNDFTHSSDFGAPFLVDSSAGDQPVQYLFSRLQVMYRTTPKAPQPYKIALLHKPSLTSSLLQGLMRIFPQARLRLFHAHEREAALAWLRPNA
jgi:hypothetical protein